MLLRRSTFSLVQIATNYRLIVGNCGNASKFGNVYRLSHIAKPCAFSVRRFGFSRPSRALPPLVWIIIRPLSQIGAIIFGRLFRRWWLRLPPGERKARIQSILNNRKGLFGWGIAGVALLSLYYYHHVESCPLTNRKRFITVTRNQFKQLCDLQSQALLTQLAPFILPEYHPTVYRVKKIAKRLLTSNLDIDEIKDYKWAVHVVNHPMPNVLVVPNGHIFVFTGMFENLANDDQLGIVLGHEMAHAVLGHGLEQWSREQLLDSLMIGLIAIIWAVVPGFTAFVTHFIANLAVKVAAHLPNHRRLEIEADEYGLQLAAKACFDPREVYAFWLALMMKGKVEGQIDMPDFLSTHPNHGDRAARLEPIIEEALKIRENCDCPMLKAYDPRILAKVKKEMIEKQLDSKGYIM